MFTTCPKCSLKLVVTAADLRVAQGYVRCGRCSNVFNALAGLSDEQQAVLAREQQPAPAREAVEAPERQRIAPERREPAATPASEARASALPEPNEPVADEADATDATDDTDAADLSLEFDPTTTDVSEVFVEATDDDPTGTFESIVLRSEDIDLLGESNETHELEIDLEAVVAITPLRPEPNLARPQTPAPTPPAAAPPAAVPPAAAPPAANEAPSRDLAARERPPPAARNLSPRAPPAELASVPAPERSPPRQRGEGDSSRETRVEAFTAELAPGLNERAAPEEDESAMRNQLLVDRGLKIGSIVLVVVLALQILNHERSALAGVSWLRAPLTAVYSALGVRIAPHWNVHAYEVRQLGAVAGPRDPGALTVRASVKNTAAHEQPLPLLRVTMQDRFGNRIAARDVPPSSYLPAGSVSPADLAAGQRVDAEIAFADPGPNAVGFEIDACLELVSGRIVCANDAAPER